MYLCMFHQLFVWFFFVVHVFDSFPLYWSIHSTMCMWATSGRTVLGTDRPFHVPLYLMVTMECTPWTPKWYVQLELQADVLVCWSKILYIYIQAFFSEFPFESFLSQIVFFSDIIVFIWISHYLIQMIFKKDYVRCYAFFTPQLN